MNQIFIIGSLLVFLLISVPFVQADSLRSVKANGTKGVEGFVDSSDTLSVKAQVSLQGVTPEVARTRLRVKTPDTRFFESCVPQDDGFFCEYIETGKWSGVRDYHVELLDADQGVIDSRKLVIAADSSSPSISSFEITPSLTKDPKVRLVLDVLDGGELCSGISEIEITDGSKKLLSIPGAKESCTFHKDVEFVFPKKSGSLDVCATARDFLGHLSEPVCKELLIDFESPEFERLEILDGSDTPNKFVPSSGDFVSFKVLLDDDSRIEEVSADFSEMLGSSSIRNPEYLTNSSFIFRNIRYVPGMPCKFALSARDILSNELVKNVSCIIGVDDKAPVIKEVRTGYADEFGTPFLGKNNEIDVTFSEEAGFGRKNAFLDLRSLNLGENVRADECTEQEPGTWLCKWSSIKPNVKSGPYSFVIRGSDNLGNSFPPKEVVVIFNPSAPVIKKVDYAPSPVTTLDTLDIVATVESEIKPDFVVNASNISSQGIVKGACQAVRVDTWACAVSVSDLKGGKNSFSLTISDGTGNFVSQSLPLEIFTAIAGPADFFSVSSVRALPARIDRRTAMKIATPQFLQLSLRSRDPKVSVLVTSASCSGDFVAGEPLVLAGSSRRPTIELGLNIPPEEVEKLNDVSVKCEVKVLAHKGNYVFTTPQEISVQKKILLYNNPLGSISENVQKKINEVTATIAVIEDKVNDARKINKGWGTAVKIGRIIGTVDMMTNLATNIMMILISGICIVASRSQILKPVCMALANGAWPGICIGNVVLRIINQAVWPPGGISGVVPAPLKMMSIFFSCQLCQYSGIVKASAQAVVGDTVVVVDGITGEKTKLDEVFTSSFDPYRSINFAQECKCFPAIEYNLEKERQIQCIYKNCIKESAKLGLPFGHCDSTLRQQQCLYVDSAAWKLTGSKFMGAFIAISEAVMATMMAASALWSFLACGPVSVAQLGGASTMPAYNPALCTGFLFVEAPEFRLTEGLLNLASVALTPAFGAAMAFTNCMTDSELMDNSGCITACGTSGATLQLYEAAALQQNPFDWGGMTSNIKGNDYCRE